MKTNLKLVMNRTGNPVVIGTPALGQGATTMNTVLKAFENTTALDHGIEFRLSLYEEDVVVMEALCRYGKIQKEFGPVKEL